MYQHLSLNLKVNEPLGLLYELPIHLSETPGQLNKPPGVISFTHLHQFINCQKQFMSYQNRITNYQDY